MTNTEQMHLVATPEQNEQIEQKKQIEQCSEYPEITDQGKLIELYALVCKPKIEENEQLVRKITEIDRDIDNNYDLWRLDMLCPQQGVGYRLEVKIKEAKREKADYVNRLIPKKRKLIHHREEITTELNKLLQERERLECVLSQVSRWIKSLKAGIESLNEQLSYLDIDYSIPYINEKGLPDYT